MIDEIYLIFSLVLVCFRRNKPRCFRSIGLRSQQRGEEPNNDTKSPKNESHCTFNTNIYEWHIWLLNIVCRESFEGERWILWLFQKIYLCESESWIISTWFDEYSSHVWHLLEYWGEILLKHCLIYHPLSTMFLLYLRLLEESALSSLDNYCCEQMEKS